MTPDQERLVLSLVVVPGPDQPERASADDILAAFNAADGPTLCRALLETAVLERGRSGAGSGRRVVPTRGVVGQSRVLNLGLREETLWAFICLPVIRLVLAWVGCDDVETWISQKLADGRDIGSDPGPMRVDVVGDAPGVVGWPDEREVGHMQWG